jgi:hypothetical protein
MESGNTSLNSFPYRSRYFGHSYDLFFHYQDIADLYSWQFHALPHILKEVKKLKSGLLQAIFSALIGLILTTIVGLCAKQGWIPAYSPLVLSIINIILNIFTINKMRRWGIFYTFGWLAGSFAFKALGLMEQDNPVPNQL